MHGTMVGQGTGDHRDRSYKVQVTKNACIITRTKRQVRATPILTEDYLRKEMSKASNQQADNKLSILIDNFPNGTNMNTLVILEWM